MGSSAFFTWGDHRILFDFGMISLPFELALLGVIAAFLAYNPIAGAVFAPKTEGKRTKKNVEINPPWWQQLGLFAALLTAGQLVFSIVPSPRFSEIGPIALRPYSLLFAGGFVVSYFISKKMFLDAGKPVEWLDTILVYFAVGTIAGARLGHCLFYDPEYYLSNPVKILAVWEGGLASHGALIGILLAVWLYVKRFPQLSFLWIVDKATVSVALAGAMIRTGNFFNSEILGHVTDVPWAVVFSSVDALPRHPSMLYEAFWYLGTALVCWKLYKKYAPVPPEGFLFGVWLILVFSGRFLLEFTKIEQAEFDAGFLNMGQWLSIPAVLAGVYFAWRALKSGAAAAR